MKNNLALKGTVESAIVLHPDAGDYTALATGAGGTGVAPVEVFDLDQPPPIINANSFFDYIWRE